MAEEKTPQDSRVEKMLKVKDLLETHEDYDKNDQEWTFLMAMYEGIRKIVAQGLVTKHERESQVSYDRRMDELYGFGYTKSVVEVFQFFLFKKPAERNLGTLHDDKLWKLFMDDADLFGADYEKTIMEIVLYASVQGHMGVLVDKASASFTSKDEQVRAKVYPYLAVYHPRAILDWRWERDENHRPYLAYLKLLDENDQYRLWFPDHWEVWEMPEDEKGEKTDSSEEADAVLVDAQPHDLGMIPFLWHYNLKSKTRGIGNSDCHEVSRIDLSIIRNASQIEEIVYYAAFPMMRKPMRDASPITGGKTSQAEDEVGVEVILEFDPDHPESKPDWLPAEVAAPVDACLKWIERKVGEIYRAANIGGMAATEPTANPQSGVAKRVDFQLLNSKMVNKAINLEDTENKILEYWLRWEQMWDKYKEEAKITRSRTYDIEDLSTDLENALTAQMVVQSDSFNKHVQQMIARQMLPNLTEKEIKEIDEEIEENVESGATNVDTFTEDVDTSLQSGDEQNASIINRGFNSLPPSEGGEASGEEMQET
jgi:hypothetical protein